MAQIFSGKTIMKAYLQLVVIFNLINFVIHIVLNKVADWELFSYNFFGSIIVYLLVSILCYLFWRVFPKAIFHPLFGVLLLVFLEFSFLTISGTSLTYAILNHMLAEQNYILLLYPFCLILVGIYIKLKFSARLLRH